MGIKELLIPKGTIFFDLFERQAGLLKEAAWLAHAITDLFKTTDAITIIKLRDIYEHLEIATDNCEDVANTLSDIAIRHS